MMKGSRIFIAGLLMMCSSAFGQSFSISPSSLLLEDTIPVDGATTLQFDLANLTNGDLELGWDLLELDFPMSWDYNLCDYLDCLLPPLPSQRNMQPIPALLSDGVYMKLWVSPEGTEGYGTAKFYVRETNNLAVGDTISYNILATGYSSVFEEQKNSVYIYPNPTNNQFTVNGIEGNAQVDLIDQSGRIVQQFFVSPSSNQLDTKFEPGVYHIRITQNGSSISKRLILQ